MKMPQKTHSRNVEDNNGLKPWLKFRDVIKRNNEPVTISTAMKNGGPSKYNWHVIRDLKEISIKRLQALKEGERRDALPMELRPNCHKHSNKGFLNVYGRMSRNETPPTITSGFLTPSMGRFGHPTKHRTISVREAATIQTFPESYKFDTSFLEYACNVVGNALPPKFAKKVASVCFQEYKKRVMV